MVANRATAGSMNYIIKKYYSNNNNTWLQIKKLIRALEENKILH